MDSSESGEDINGRVERDGDPGGSSGQKETSTADMLRFYLLVFIFKEKSHILKSTFKMSYSFTMHLVNITTFISE